MAAGGGKGRRRQSGGHLLDEALELVPHLRELVVHRLAGEPLERCVGVLLLELIGKLLVPKDERLGIGLLVGLASRQAVDGVLCG